MDWLINEFLVKTKIQKKVARELPLNPFTLQFNKSRQNLEGLYQQYSKVEHSKSLVFFFVALVVVQLVYLIHDYVGHPQSAFIYTLDIRLCVCIMLAFLLLLARKIPKFSSSFIALAIFITNVAMTVVSVIWGIFLYLPSTCTFFWIGYTLPGSSQLKNFISGIAFIILLVFYERFFNTISDWGLNIIFYVDVVYLISLVTSYNSKTEVLHRGTFLILYDKCRRLKAHTSIDFTPHEDSNELSIKHFAILTYGTVTPVGENDNPVTVEDVLELDSVANKHMKQMRKKFSWKFADEKIEKEYNEYYLGLSDYKIVPVSVVNAIVMIAFVYRDFEFAGVHLKEFMLLRFGVVVPSLLILLTTLFKDLRRFRNQITTAVITICCVVFDMMLMLSIQYRGATDMYYGYILRIIAVALTDLHLPPNYSIFLVLFSASLIFFTLEYMRAHLYFYITIVVIYGIPYTFWLDRVLRKEFILSHYPNILNNSYFKGFSEVF
eukprot:TRINITY_DN2074_c0_g1_i3.p1 TRINITY_DN2074_c0_g1~~TRINITY_DN2074_c0_g1_i3.p1  ORF type:complete len:492 (+),score=37.09 TRINITY_DN2074_c0_g1_i3:304-1779(+)